MRRVLLRGLAAAASAAVFAATATALEVPPTPTTYLTDFAGVIPASRAAAIDRRLKGIEERTGHQVIAVLFPSLAGEPLEDFTIRCAEKWKVGRKGHDDGAIFFAFIRDHRMRLEVGYGLESTIPDALAGRLLDQAVKPAFARGDYAGGVDALASALAATFRGQPPPLRRREGPQPSLGLVVFVLIGLALRFLLAGRSRGWVGWYGGGFGGGGFGGGFSAGGGSFGGGGASGSW